MGSTGEPDRKRRHCSSLSPTTAAMAKKQPFSLPYEDKKLDTAVLRFQNQKLLQKLEAQKVEYSALENKFSQLKEKQQPYDSTLKAVNKSWEVLVTDLEQHSNCTRETTSAARGFRCISTTEDRVSHSFKDAFLSRLVETGATETSSGNDCLNLMEDNKEISSEKTRNITSNIVTAIDDVWKLKDGIHAAVLNEISEDGSSSRKESCELAAEVKNLRLALSDLHLKHKTRARELQSCRDISAKNKAELKRLKGELESAVSELEEINSRLATLKAERDATKGAFFPVLNVGNKPVAGDKARDKQKNLQEMESALKELQDQTSSQLLELKRLHDERIKILQQLSHLQNSFKNLKCISSSRVYMLLRDQLEKSKVEVHQYQSVYEKLQFERDNLVWREKELSIKSDLVDVSRRCSAVDSRIADLETEMQSQMNERNMIEAKLEEASKEPGRKEIIAEFKALLSSFPDEMGNMQRQLNNYKEAASDIHTLQADVRSLSTVLDRKVKECESLSSRSKDQAAEIERLQSLVQDLKESHLELKLILEMYRRESTDSRDILEARDLEFKAWAQVQSLKSSLDEQQLELRVKTANEAEAMSQQRLAAAEAEIADLRQKLDASKRDAFGLSDVLKSKTEENEAYLSEIESIGQAYDDMQTQNQHLLQQITERDDYNVKLMLEGVKARQLKDSLLMDKQTSERKIQQANTSLDFFNVNAARIENQLKTSLDQVHSLTKDKSQKSVALENTRKRLADVRKSFNHARESLDASQFKVEKSRAGLLDLQIELEKERFDKRRTEEELEIGRRKVLYLRAQIEGSSIVQKLQQELKEYREIVTCNICHERPKEVVITKCYHLFCNPCVQRIIESRHRKCPACATNFGSNDVKPVYI